VLNVLGAGQDEGGFLVIGGASEASEAIQEKLCSGMQPNKAWEVLRLATALGAEGISSWLQHYMIQNFSDVSMLPRENFQVWCPPWLPGDEEEEDLEPPAKRARAEHQVWSTEQENGLLRRLLRGLCEKAQRHSLDGKWVFVSSDDGDASDWGHYVIFSGKAGTQHDSAGTALARYTLKSADPEFIRGRVTGGTDANFYGKVSGKVLEDSCRLILECQGLGPHEWSGKAFFERCTELS